jgi:hypothetical protein
LLVRLAAKRVGIDPSERYLILGDDLVIADPNIARIYQELMGQLGVEIDLGKSRLCTKRDNQIVYSRSEFTKRLFLNGTELSPLPLRLLENPIHPVDETNFLLHLVDRGWHHELTNLTSLSRDGWISMFSYRSKHPLVLCYATMRVQALMTGRPLPSGESLTGFPDRE